MLDLSTATISRALNNDPTVRPQTKRRVLKLARDIGYFAEQGYALADLRAFDLFPMTHHVECVALLVPEAR